MGFSAGHPAINLIYFSCVIAAGVLIRHPAYLAISLICAFAYAVKLNRGRAAAFGLALLPCAAAFAAWYSTTHHFGITVLRQNFIQNNTTLEALCCGAAIGLSIAAMLLWLSCVHAIFTADKAVYLFGRVSPRLSLFLAILLRMAPRIKNQARKINAARCGIGRGANQGNPLQRMGNALKILSMLITWTIEMLTGASESMRSRGSNLRGRTAFSIYRFDNRDRAFVIALFALLTALGMGVLLRQSYMRFSPAIRMAQITPVSCAFYLAYAALCATPLILDLHTEASFRRARRRNLEGK